MVPEDSLLRLSSGLPLQAHTHTCICIHMCTYTHAQTAFPRNTGSLGSFPSHHSNQVSIVTRSGSQNQYFLLNLNWSWVSHQGAKCVLTSFKLSLTCGKTSQDDAEQDGYLGKWAQAGSPSALGVFIPSRYLREISVPPEAGGVWAPSTHRICEIPVR